MYILQEPSDCYSRICLALFEKIIFLLSRLKLTCSTKRYKDNLICTAAFHTREGRNCSIFGIYFFANARRFQMLPQEADPGPAATFSVSTAI